MKIFLPLLFAMDSTLALGLTYKGMIGDVGVFKDEKCRSIFVKLTYEVGDSGAFFVEHDGQVGATIAYMPNKVGNGEVFEQIPFDKKCDAYEAVTKQRVVKPNVTK